MGAELENSISGAAGKVIGCGDRNEWWRQCGQWAVEFELWIGGKGQYKMEVSGGSGH